MRLRIVEDAATAGEPVTAIYVRVTQEESVKTDLSLPNQRGRALELCEEHGWSPVRVYQEPRHVGGELMPERRPALAQMLADAAAGRVSRVLVRHTDRLWRGTEVQDRIFTVLRLRSVELWDFAGQKEYRSAGGRFALKVQGAAAEYEKNLTGERIREMKRGKARAGKLGGGPPPFGYASQSRLKRELLAQGIPEDEAHRQACERYPVAKTWYVDEAEADVVRLIFRLYISERRGGRRISEELNRLGHRRRGGFPWSPVKVGKIVNNPALSGLTSYDEEAYRKGLPSASPRFRQVLFQGTHAPIIPVADWKEAQRLKAEVNAKRIRTPTAGARVYPLSGVLRCGECGSPMPGKSSGTAREPYYICSRRAYYGPKDGCLGPTIHQKWAEVTVWKYLDRLFASPEIVRDVLARAQKKLAAASPEMCRRLDDVRSEIATLKANQDKWVKKFESAKDDASAELVWSRVRELKGKELDLAREASEIEAKLAAPPRRSVSLDDIRRHLKRLGLGTATGPEERRRFVEALEHHHDIRVRLLAGRRLVVSLRLDRERVSLIGPAEPEDAIGTRLVLAGAVDTTAGGRASGAGVPRKTGARRSHEQQVVTARRRQLQRAPRHLLAAHVAEVIGAEARVALDRRRGQREQRRALAAQGRDHLGQRRHRLHHAVTGDDGRLVDVGARHEQAPQPLRARPCGDRQHAAHGSHATVERQLAHEQAGLQRRRVEHARGAQHAHGDRHVEGGAVLAQIGGREVDGDPPRRKLEAAVLERTPDADPPLFHPRVGQPHDMTAGQPDRDVDLDVDGGGFDADDGG